MKTIKLILITLFIGMPVFVSAQEKSTTTVQAERRGKDASKMSPLERAKFITSVKGSRKLAINPVKQTDGIKTGCIIAYGHYLKPPYKLENIGEKLLINGVQVAPSLIREREQAQMPKVIITTKMEEDFKRRRKLEIDAYLLYQAGKGKKAEQDLKNEVLAFVQASTNIVVDAYWDRFSKDDNIVVKYVGASSLSDLSFYRKPIGFISTDTTKSEKRGLNRAAVAREQSRLRVVKGLNDGGCLVFHSDGGRSAFPYNDLIRSCVNKSMGDTGLSSDQRIESVAKCFAGDYHGAMDILENYNPDEWEMLQE